MEALHRFYGKGGSFFALSLTLLLMVLTWGVAPAAAVTTVTATNCITCHGTTVVQSHHQTTYYTSGQCNVCHTGITTTGTCSGCHNFSLTNNAHHVPAPGTQINCATCHTNTKDLTNCLSCHAGKTRVKHHQIAAAGTTCKSCHTTMEATQVGAATAGTLACASCHTSKTEMQERHHAKAKSTPIACTSCHTQIKDASNCFNCHTQGSKRAVHHATTNPAFGDCQKCHSALPPTVTMSGGCVACHASGDNRTLHHTTVKTSKNLSCTSCHTQMTTSADCRSCHLERTMGGNGTYNRHHDGAYLASKGYPVFACTDCHSIAFSPSVGFVTRMPSTTQCFTCHSGPGMPPIAEQHHASPKYAAGDCVSCHAGVGTNLTCGSCHGGTSGTLAARHHNTIAPANNKGCNDCHTNAGTVLTECKSCHTTKVSTAPIAVQHHMRGQAGNIACSSCHTNAMSPNMVCSTCHYTRAGVTTLAPRHHATTAGQTGQCVSCHKGTEAVKIACSSCHVTKKHHQRPEATSGNCNFCHTGLLLQGGSCKGCHTSPIPELHHGAPLAERGGNCAACHQATSDPRVCANCHSGTDPHHTTTYSKAGNCEHCHKVPATTLDRPKQAACRQCHGQFMHNKGGPIQNYGSCAACHTTTAFHGAPGGPMGYAVMRPAGSKYPTGKGTFAVFWNQYTRGGQDEVRENVSPNGEDMNDEGGRRWSRPTLTFSLKAITNTATGKSFQVPSFDGYPIPGGGTPPSDPVLVNGNLALNKPSSASRQETGFESFRAFDSNNTSYWWARSTSEQWLQVDLGSSVQINNISLSWHLTDYARSYVLEVSTTGSSWTQVVSRTGFTGGKIEHSFTARSARYVRLRASNPVNSNGYMLYEMRVFNQAATTPVVSNLALNKTASATRQESGFEASRAVDGNATSRWSARSTSTQSWRVDLGTSTSISRVVIDWHTDFARDFAIQVSTDGSNWTSVKSVTSASGGVQTHTFTARTARHVRINCTRANNSNGYSIEELEVYAQ